jgi:hypothetical protein
MHQPDLYPGRRPARRLIWLALFLGVSLALIWEWSSGRPAVLATDLNQHRLNVALPPPIPGAPIRQSFTPRHDGLAELEVLIARADLAAGPGAISFTLVDGAGRPVASDSVPASTLAHNQSYALRFPAQAHSAGQPYNLVVEGTTGNNVSLWAYDLDVLAGGELASTGPAGDLRLLTRYRLDARLAAGLTVATLREVGPLLALALALILMPGLLWLLAGRGRGTGDPAADLALALALGLATWPLLWLWLTVAGGRWRPWSLWLLFGIGWLAIAVLLARRLAKRRRGRRAAAGRSGLSWHHAALLLILLAGLAVRLLAVHDLAFPPWVDSTRHALITQVMSESGQAMRDYRPLLPVDRFLYHFGFHTLSASLELMTGLPLPRLLLAIGQLLNALIPLTVYGAGVWLTGRRGPGLVAAFLVALPFLFPGYYATWGRMTQLDAMAILAAAVGLTWRLVRGGPGWRPAWPALGLLVAGLFLVHFRVLLLYLPFAALLWLGAQGRRGRTLGRSAVLALALTLPHLVRLAADARGTAIFTQPAGYSDFPAGYVATGLERLFLILGGAALILSVLAMLRRRRWAVAPLHLGAWVIVVAVALSTGRLGFPQSWVINLNSAFISAFLPLSLLIGVVADRLLGWLTAQVARGHAVSSASRGRAISSVALGLGCFAAIGYLVASASLFGLRQQVAILNPETILAWEQDVAGLEWLADKAPAGARVAVNSWQWIGTTWAGADGGAWIVPLTGLDATTPPADYVYDLALHDRVDAFNQAARAVTDWADPASGRWLRQQGVSHVFVGARGGFLDPSALMRNPELRPLLARDGVFIFAVR